MDVALTNLRMEMTKRNTHFNMTFIQTFLQQLDLLASDFSQIDSIQTDSTQIDSDTSSQKKTFVIA